MDEAGRVNAAEVRLNGQPPFEAALAATGGAQWAVVSLDQLVELGLSARAVQRRASTGRLHRLYQGVYSLVPPNLLTREGLWLAAVLACGPGAALSHRSAAALHGLLPSGGSRIDVIVAGRSCRKHRGIDVHRSKTLSCADLTTVRNIPCTTVARTQLDMADAVDRRRLERAFDQAEILGVFDLRAIEEQLMRNASRAAAAVVRAVLDEHYVGTTETWSQLEERFLDLCREAGLPRPEVNAWVTLSDHDPPIRADFVWRAERVIVECDGRKFHGTRQAFERDRRRDQRTLAAGWRTVRTTWRQLERAPQEVVFVVLELLSQ